VAQLTPALWLVVEDDDDDFFLFRRACSAALDPLPTIRRETDGSRAQAFLSSSHEPPQLVISDLKMPRMSGLELLDWARHQPNLQKLRFIILSSSDMAQDLQASRRLGVDEYRFKPSQLSEFVQVIKEVSRAAHAAASESEGA